MLLFMIYTRLGAITLTDILRIFGPMLSKPVHYENKPMQYTDKIFGCKNDNFQWKNFEIFLLFAQNIDCEYPQSMFWSKNKKNRYTPAYPSFAI